MEETSGKPYEVDCQDTSNNNHDNNEHDEISKRDKVPCLHQLSSKVCKDPCMSGSFFRFLILPGCISAARLRVDGRKRKSLCWNGRIENSY